MTLSAPILQYKDIENAGDAEIAVVGFRPQVFVGNGIDQLHVDPDPVAGPLHAAFEHGRNTEFAGDLRDRFFRVLVLHDRGARDDFERADLAKLGQQVVMDAFGEAVIRTIASPGGKRDHGDRPVRRAHRGVFR